MNKLKHHHCNTAEDLVEFVNFEINKDMVIVSITESYSGYTLFYRES